MGRKDAVLFMLHLVGFGLVCLGAFPVHAGECEAAVHFLEVLV